MRRRLIGVVCAAVVAGPLVAQPPAAPEVLPPTVLEPVARAIAGPVSAAELAKQREALIKSLKEELVTFEPGAVTARQTDGRWQVRTNDVVLKDFGADRVSAMTAAKMIQDLRANQMGTVKGANPPLEYWLADGKPPRLANSRAVLVPLIGRAIRAEYLGGTWIVTDGAKGLHDFGTDSEAAKRAAAVYWKYGFNQLAVIGTPQPTMFVPLADPTQAAREKVNPGPTANAIAVVSDVSKTSLLLPGNVYAGPKLPIDSLKLQVVRRQGGEVALVHGDDVLARFGSSEVDARTAMRALQDGHVTEVARIGSAKFPLFLSNGQAIHGQPLGATKRSIRAERLKLQKIRETWWLVEDSRPLIEAGTRDDAELLAKVIRFYDLQCVCVIGRVETGGLRLLTMGR